MGGVPISMRAGRSRRNTMLFSSWLYAKLAASVGAMWMSQRAPDVLTYAAPTSTKDIIRGATTALRFDGPGASALRPGVRGLLETDWTAIRDGYATLRRAPRTSAEVVELNRRAIAFLDKAESALR